MELNVCSRRVHDGYATIRTRGRPRPKAVYRSDSEELLKEANGPYAPSEMCSMVSQVPKWQDDDGNEERFLENFGVPKRSPRRVSLEGGGTRMPDDKVPILNTFASGARVKRHGSLKTTMLERSYGNSGTQIVRIASNSNGYATDRESAIGGNPHYDAVPVDDEETRDECLEKSANFDEKSAETRPGDGAGAEGLATIEVPRLAANNCAVDGHGSPGGGGEEDRGAFLEVEKRNNKRAAANKTRQPIYAIPNVPRLNKPPRGSRESGVEGNYVPSGDLYRSTARYIEDLNRTVAKMDEKRVDDRSPSDRSSAYGVIKKIAKESSSSCVEESPRNIYGGHHRKRDMAPMPPISPNFGEHSDEKEFEFKSPLPPPPTSPKKLVNSRPNSFGKLPPKILPRSSSIENTSSRNSNGSSSSTRSTESLYAISEALTGLPKNRVTFREPNEIDDDDDDERIPRRPETYHTLPAKRSAFRKGKRERIASLGSKDDDLVDRRGRQRSFANNREPEDDGILDDVFAIGPNEDRSSTIGRRNRPIDRSASISVTNRRKNFRSHEDILGDTLAAEATYGTLPYRKPKLSPRPLHKSSEDVLDTARDSGIDTGDFSRAYKSTMDVRDHQARNAPGRLIHGPWINAVPDCLMDATDVIMKGQLLRSRERIKSESQEDDEVDDNHRVVVGRGQFRGGAGNQSRLVADDEAVAVNRPPNKTRTRHNSLELDSDASTMKVNYATLPRRGNASKSDQEANDGPKRLSGTVPVLEPLYEHAVSDPVKPRNPDNVIPWWELATRKYRHRSCPSLQAHVVSAFEQSLSNMTQRLQHLTATAEKKDSELQELRETIERLRKQSAEAGLNATNNAAANGRRHTLGDSESTTGCTGSNSNHHGSSMARQLSADSVTSLNSLSSACSASSHHKKKGWLRSSFSKAFSRSRKNRHGSVSDAEDCKDGHGGEISAPNSPRLPTAAKHESQAHGHGQGARSNGQRSPEHENGLTGSKSSSALYKKEDEDVDELKKQLREKDMVLTDIRLEALSSAHQLESLKDTVIKMRNEMLNLKQNNERLQRLVTSKSLTSSQSSLPSDPERRFSMTEVASSVAAMSSGGNPSNSDQLEDMGVPDHPVVPAATMASNEPPIEQDTDGKKISVAVYLGSERSFNYNVIGSSNSDGSSEPPHCVVASVCISNKTTWDSLDATVRRCFKEYVARVDPVTNLGLGVECVTAYHLGEASRCTNGSQLPELLPCGYLVGHVKTIYLVLAGYSWLAVDTLIPRSIVQRLVSLLTEHRRVILCGPSGTGKSYLAGKLAHALVDADSETKDAASVATFNVDHKSSKELRQYLAHIAERCDSSAADELPRVIILENLQHAASLGELFSGLLGTRHSSCPAIIGTMSQATCSTTNLQLHHNFRWVLCANHMEPVKGFLGRYLRRRLLEHELRESGGARNAEMAAVVEWIPRVWLHLNKFLETHSSSDVTIGPRLFLSCPMEVAGSQVWFTDVWNYSVVPYLVDAIREGLTLYGRRISGNGNTDSPWADPAQFITSSYPWIATHAVHGGSDALRRLRPEDVGYDVVSSGHNSAVGASSVKSLGSTHSDTEGDPLLNMLMRLQEAANYSSPHSNDSDSVTSLDSSHTRHSEDLTCSSSTSSSRGVESTL